MSKPKAVLQLNKILEAGSFREKAFTRLNRSLRRGDFYLAARHSGPWLLEVERVDRNIGVVVPTSEEAPWFDIPECFGVRFEA